MKNKKAYIPGWFDTVNNRVDYYGLDIWKEKIDPESKIDAEYVIGHSLGANFALLNWDINKNAKLILTNPAIGKKSITQWFLRWIKFIFSEGPDMNKKRARSFLNFFYNCKLCYKLLKIDLEKIIKKIPKENIVVIRGKNDNFFCNSEVCNFLREEGIKIIEIDEVGHHWDNKMSEEINKLIEKQA